MSANAPTRLVQGKAPPPPGHPGTLAAPALTERGLLVGGTGHGRAE